MNLKLNHSWPRMALAPIFKLFRSVMLKIGNAEVRVYEGNSQQQFYNRHDRKYWMTGATRRWI